MGHLTKGDTMYPDNMTGEQAQQHLDELRESHPINSALQNLATFTVYTLENKGVITPREALYLVEAAENTVNVLLPECERLAQEVAHLRLLNRELSMYLAVGSRKEGNA